MIHKIEKLKRENIIRDYNKFLKEIADKYDVKSAEARRIILRFEMGKYSELQEYAAQL